MHRVRGRDVDKPLVLRVAGDPVTQMLESMALLELVGVRDSEGKERVQILRVGLDGPGIANSSFGA